MGSPEKIPADIGSFFADCLETLNTDRIVYMHVKSRLYSVVHSSMFLQVPGSSKKFNDK